MAQADPRARSLSEDDDSPSEIVVYAGTDDEHEPQAEATPELLPAPGLQRGRDRARQTILGALSRSRVLPFHLAAPTAPPAAPRRLPGLRAVRAHGGTAARQDDDTDDDADGPSAIVLHADADDEREPQVGAASELGPAPELERGRGRPHARGRWLEQAIFGVRSRSDGERLFYHAAPTAPQSAPRRPPGIRPRGLPKITTLAVLDLPALTTQQQFLDEVNSSGFAGEYDFAYLPRRFQCDFSSFTRSGSALINFTTSESAVEFAAAWHLSERLGVRAVRVSPASVHP